MAYQPPEYGPELSAQFLSRLTSPIDDMERQDEGRAYAESAARGLSGQATEGSLVGNVRSGARRDKSNAIADFNYKLAGMQRDERLTRENRDASQGFAADQAEKDRKFKEHLTEMGFAHETGMLGAEQGFERIQAQQGAVVGALSGGTAMASAKYFA